jgi:hypothetical protein
VKRPAGKGGGQDTVSASRSRRQAEEREGEKLRREKRMQGDMERAIADDESQGNRGEE